ncbi:hypothetical protein PLANPX_2564 [Lacipirellula parvula]|uniref:Uncharacterized protein n=1 Tax=Lacipirellula parvula TaxID=2650471 RepID=A0A5K7XAI3_9BACT|nr:hypothetical protein PLANPX_2564 [Lacipirellula parvula]
MTNGGTGAHSSRGQQVAVQLTPIDEVSGGTFDRCGGDFGDRRY